MQVYAAKLQKKKNGFTNRQSARQEILTRYDFNKNLYFL